MEFLLDFCTICVDAFARLVTINLREETRRADDVQSIKRRYEGRDETVRVMGSGSSLGSHQRLGTASESARRLFSRERLEGKDDRRRKSRLSSFY